jgi:hypothetical protein
MTEEEAKTKWCPYGAGVPTLVSISGGNTMAENQTVTYHDGPKEKARCIAYQCMAWRWRGPRHYEGAEGYSKPPRVGYCGLAGEIVQ